MTRELHRPRGAGQASSLLAVARYELLSNIRRKKIVGLFAIAVVVPALVWIPKFATMAGMPNPPFADALTGPRYDILLSGSYFLPLLALIIAMDSIAGEFESRTIETLLTKPVSRAAIYFGKFVGGLVSLLAVLAVVLASETVFSTIFYGPQDNLYLLAYYFVGVALAGLVLLSMVLFLASATKKSLLTVLGVIAYIIFEQVVEPLWGQYFPSYGVGFYVPGIARHSGAGLLDLGPLLAYFAGNPGKSAVLSGCSSPCIVLSTLVLQDVLVGAAYTTAFLGAGYLLFRRAEIK